MKYFLTSASVSLVTALALVACGSSVDANATATSSSSSTSGGGGSSADVTGTIVDTMITDQGNVPLPVDPSTTSISAWAESGGKLVQFQGTLTGDGKFKIAGVPEGEFTLEEDDQEGIGPSGVVKSFYITSLRSIDLGRIRYGRPDRIVPGAPTTFSSDAAGMQPWQDTDSLELFSLGAGAWDYLNFQSPPAAGAVSLQGLTFDASLEVLPGLVEAGKGDKAFITQLGTSSAAGIPYQGLVAVYTPSLSQKEGAASKLMNGAFSSVPQEMASLTWNRTKFMAFASAVSPTATFDSHALGAYAEPGGDKVGAGGLAELLYLTDTGTGDVKLDVSYGNPFPAGWEVDGYANTTFATQYTVPGAGKQKNQYAFVSVNAPFAKLAAGPIDPVISPVQGIQVNGKAATADLTGVGMTPTVSWSAPAIGTAALYYVTIKTNDPAANYYLTTVASLRTTSTSVTIPPGVLSAGTPYRLVVTARTDYDAAAPNHYSTTSSTADALTEFITP